MSKWKKIFTFWKFWNKFQRSKPMSKWKNQSVWSSLMRANIFMSEYLMYKKTVTARLTLGWWWSFKIICNSSLGFPNTFLNHLILLSKVKVMAFPRTGVSHLRYIVPTHLSLQSFKMCIFITCEQPSILNHMICPKFSPFDLYSLLKEKSLIFTSKLIFWGVLGSFQSFSLFYFSCDGLILIAEKWPKERN